MKTIILAGGLGTRLQEETAVKPKPMVEIGKEPILWHIMNIYAAYGFQEFVVALGYRGEWVKKYFLNYHQLQHDLKVDLGTGEIKMKNGHKKKWMVDLVDTGVETQTGGRIKRLSSFVENETFMVTYGDGVANVDIKKLVEFHKKHGKLATMTVVRPPARFGSVEIKDSQVVDFAEKLQVKEGWINGGFFVLEPAVLERIQGDKTFFELDPLEGLAKEGQLMAYQHEGFWQCMDTLRDVRTLKGLWDSGKAPWKVWK